MSEPMAIFSAANEMLTQADAVRMQLQALYSRAGYGLYRQQTFEEYALYLENKRFLGSEQAITFNDISGRMLALQPDVTLSVVKHTRATRARGEKLFYHEKVYRMDPRSREFREIDQVGLEVLGEVDGVQTLEVCALALQSLAVLGGEYALNISHMGFLSGLFDAMAVNEGARSTLVGCIRARNAHDLQLQAARAGLSPRATAQLVALTALSGDFQQALQVLDSMALNATLQQAVEEMHQVYRGLCALGYGAHLRLDFSIASDIHYYNGILFQGYLSGAPKAVLSGGRYDHLASRLGQDIGAMGFAIYLSDLPAMGKGKQSDADVLLVYTEQSDVDALMQKAQALRAQGLRVRLERTLPQGLCVDRIEEG